MKTLRLTYQLIAIPAAFSLSTCHTQSSQQQPTPPNIIYILADDMDMAISMHLIHTRRFPLQH